MAGVVPIYSAEERRAQKIWCLNDVLLTDGFDEHYWTDARYENCFVLVFVGSSFVCLRWLVVATIDYTGTRGCD